MGLVLMGGTVKTMFRTSNTIIFWNLWLYSFTSYLRTFHFLSRLSLLSSYIFIHLIFPYAFDQFHMLWFSYRWFLIVFPYMVIFHFIINIWKPCITGSIELFSPEENMGKTLEVSHVFPCFFHAFSCRECWKECWFGHDIFIVFLPFCLRKNNKK